MQTSLAFGRQVGDNKAAKNAIQSWLLSYASLIERYYREADDRLCWWTEHMVIDALSSSAWMSGLPAIAEWQVNRRRLNNVGGTGLGRVDLWVKSAQTEYVIEFKHVRVRGEGDFRIVLDQRLTEAKEQLDRIVDPGRVNWRMTSLVSCVPVVTSWNKGSQDADKDYQAIWQCAQQKAESHQHDFALGIHLADVDNDSLGPTEVPTTHYSYHVGQVLYGRIYQRTRV